MVSTNVHLLAMAYDEYTADRIRSILDFKKVAYRELRMMGGWCVMVDEKMCCGLLTDKADGQPVLMARIGEEAASQALEEGEVQAGTGSIRPMKGYVFVHAAGIDQDADLENWIERCLAYNPLAKASKKRKKSGS